MNFMFPQCLRSSIQRCKSFSGIALASLGSQSESVRLATALGIGDSSVNYVVDKVAAAIIDAFFEEVIRLPNKDQPERGASKILRERGLPGCFGAVDGKHWLATGGTFIICCIQIQYLHSM